MSVAAFILGIFWLWGRVEKASDERKLALHQHMPIPSECTYSSDQASVIVVPTVTIPEHKDRVLPAVANTSLSAADFAKVTVLESTPKGKRAQLSLGIRHAKGTTLATSDDHISYDRNFLNGMLPCPDDETDRQSRDVITPWEVAAMRVAVAWHRSSQLKAMYALQSHRWTIAIQALPETEVRRTVKISSDLLKQIFRWERSATYIRQCFVVRKTWGRLLRLVLTTCHILAWVFAFLSGDRACGFASLLIAWYIFKSYPSYRNFFAKYPYTRRTARALASRLHYTQLD
ncbi:glycosyltransferase family 2 protein [Hyaloscypha bicolor E]|uniref:Glycosyltransferase family 2 protein n=1 Tax=Hyaloscypha bicolor E TaxID=1095630 RepID=A0A2J6SQP9_9HELO|nr:glycosyltransferase family 2 protein [Hyaloscypha bicolor E]PMD53059.1 glycosyltransferase family 2 protein [Hyaloscypha bicolor E]